MKKNELKHLSYNLLKICAELFVTLSKKGHEQVNQKDFQGSQKDVGMVEAKQVSKQGKDCKGSYRTTHPPMCHKQVPPSHVPM